MEEEILKFVVNNPLLNEVIRRAHRVPMTNWAFGAGCIAQTIWNQKTGRDSNYGINDIDLVYFDKDLEFESEDRNIKAVRKIFEDLPMALDIKNQARVHLWYEKHFGYAIVPYTSVESAIDTWPTSATCIGIFPTESPLRVYAPFGIEDALNMMVRPNKKQITREIYEKKVSRWIATWPELSIVPW